MDYFWQEAKEFLSNVIFKNIPTLLIALLVFWIGLQLIKWVNRLLERFFERKKVEQSLRYFLRTVLNITLRVLLILTVMDMIGIAATSFIAILGAAGIAIGMALQGTLQNFAGGVIILVLKPYKVGDYIEQGIYKGFVQNIKIFNTVLKTFDNTEIIVPNTDLATKALINYTTLPTRRIDVNVSIAYGQSVEKARSVLLQLADSHPKTLHGEGQQPVVVVNNLGESSVNLCFRLWVKTEDYWETFYYMNQAVYEKFNENGISIPFNQLDVHLSKD